MWSQNGLLACVSAQACVCVCVSAQACMCMCLFQKASHLCYSSNHAFKRWLVTIQRAVQYCCYTWIHHRGRYGNGFVHSTLHKHSLHIHMHTLLTHLAHTPYIATCITRACMATHAHLGQSTRISYLVIGNLLLVMHEAASSSQLPAGGNYH